MSTAKQPKATLVDIAYDRIRADISTNTLKPGQKITFQELVKNYEISETPIKQALNRMVVEGLVEAIPHRGMRIKPISVQDYNETMDIRYMLEIHFAPIIMEAVNYNLDYIDALEANIKKHYNAIEIGTTEINDFLEIYSIDHDFHRLFLKCANHQKALQVYDTIGAHTFSYFLYNKKPKNRLIAGVQEHENMLQALKDQDLDALLAAIKVHVDGARTSIIYAMNRL